MIAAEARQRPIASQGVGLGMRWQMLNDPCFCLERTGIDQALQFFGEERCE